MPYSKTVQFQKSFQTDILTTRGLPFGTKHQGQNLQTISICPFQLTLVRDYLSKIDRSRDRHFGQSCRGQNIFHGFVYKRIWHFVLNPLNQNLRIQAFDSEGIYRPDQ